MKILKFAVYGFALIGFAYVAFALYVSFGSMATCQGNKLKSTVSPNGQHLADLVIEDCKGKSGPNLVLSISDKSDPRQSFNSELGVATTTDLDLTWLSDHSLQIAYPSKFQLTQEAPSLHGIDLRFAMKAITSHSLNDDMVEATHR